MKPTYHHYLCADCGRETTRSINDWGFGLCEDCENRMHQPKPSWPADKQPVAPLARIGCTQRGPVNGR